MNYFDVKAKADTILSKKKITLTMMVMLLIFFMYVARIISMVFTTNQDFLDTVVSLGLNVIGIMIANTIFFCILSHMREGHFGIKELRFSITHLPMQIILGVVYTMLRFLLDTVLSVFGMMLPFIYLPINLCLMILYLAAECTIAYCIYDNGSNVMEIVRGIIQFVKAKWRILLRSGYMYLLSYFLYAVCLISVISGSLQTDGEMLDIMKTINYIASDPWSGTVLSILGLTFLFWIVFAYLELRVFLSAAILYDENKPIYFSRIKIKNAG